MATIHIGARGEQSAAEYLAAEGFEILEMNYRRKHCEIDIVARRQDIIYFVEVKYRSTNRYGGGLDYISPLKIRHMQRAAETWATERHWEGEYTLSAIAVSGTDFTVDDFIVSIY